MVRSAGAVPSTIAAMMRGDREGEGSEQADVAFDPALPLGNLGEGGNAAEPDIVDPSTGLGDGGEQPRFVLRRLYYPENSDVRRLALSEPRRSPSPTHSEFRAIMLAFLVATLPVPLMRKARPRSPLPLLRPTNGSDADTLLTDMRRLKRAAASEFVWTSAAKDALLCAPAGRN
jgi:hypothetical protein